MSFSVFMGDDTIKSAMHAFCNRFVHPLKFSVLAQGRMSQASHCECGIYCMVCFSERDNGTSSPSLHLLQQARRNHKSRTADFFGAPAILYTGVLLSRIKSTEEAQLKVLEDDMFNELITERGMHGISIDVGFDTYSTARKHFIEADAVRKRLYNFIHRFVKSTPGITNENYKARRQQGEQLWLRILTRVPAAASAAVCPLFLNDSSFWTHYKVIVRYHFNDRLFKIIYWLFDKSQHIACTMTTHIRLSDCCAFSQQHKTRLLKHNRNTIVMMVDLDSWITKQGIRM